MPSIEELLNSLKQVKDPELGRDLVDLGMIRDLQINAEGQVSFTLVLTILGCPMRQKMADEAEKVLLTHTGVTEVKIEFAQMSEEDRKKIFLTVNPVLPQLSSFNKVGQVIAIMSGKGGVGKSSVTALLASALNKLGYKVGILDADVTGPSIPKLFGLPAGGLPEAEQGILPGVSKKGIKIISTNLLINDEDRAIIWRGPMISSTIQRFWRDTLWGYLDFLLVDMPPGTSDAALTVMRQLPLTGAVLITTPQQLAGMVVKKAVNLAEKMNTPLLAIVENMSYFVCPDNGKQYEIFGPSHIEELVDSGGFSTWTRLPINPEIALLCDAGQVEDAEPGEILELAKTLAKRPK
jgi:Mrp family chromosome partitioning ATPase